MIWKPGDQVVFHHQPTGPVRVIKRVFMRYGLGFVELTDLVGDFSENLFKAAYTDFSNALLRVKDGRKMRRGCWPALCYIAIQENALQFFIAGATTRYEFESDDLLASDWHEYKENVHGSQTDPRP